MAEWVETPEVLNLLVDMGVEYGQGYLFRKPMPLEDTIQVPAARFVRARSGSA